MKKHRQVENGLVKTWGGISVQEERGTCLARSFRVAIFRLPMFFSLAQRTKLGKRDSLLSKENKSTKALWLVQHHSGVITITAVDSS